MRTGYSWTAVAPFEGFFIAARHRNQASADLVAYVHLLFDILPPYEARSPSQRCAASGMCLEP